EVVDTTSLRMVCEVFCKRERNSSQQTASSLKKVGKKKLLGRKGVHTSQSTIPIEEGDPDAKHKLCIKYASDEDSAFDYDTPVHLYAVVDWELLPTGVINSPCYHNKELASPEQTATVPIGRVVVPTGRYVVPAGKVIIIVSPGRLNLVPTGRILSPGKVK
ncbi:hypothetical protein Tco_0186104, partial [Tanacetum coccineum]